MGVFEAVLKEHEDQLAAIAQKRKFAGDHRRNALSTYLGLAELAVKSVERDMMARGWHASAATYTDDAPDLMSHSIRFSKPDGTRHPHTYDYELSISFPNVQYAAIELRFAGNSIFDRPINFNDQYQALQEKLLKECLREMLKDREDAPF